MCEFKTFYGDTCLEGKELLEAKIEHPIELEYYKTYTNIAETRNTIYGVEVVKKEYIENEVMKESKEINLLTKDEALINKVIQKLKENKVTPFGLPDIISELF